MALTWIDIVGTFLLDQSHGAEGVVTVQPFQRMVDSTGNVIMEAVARQRSPGQDGVGRVLIRVVASDSDDIEPQDVPYLITIAIEGAPQWGPHPVIIPKDAPGGVVNLADVVPADEVSIAFPAVGTNHGLLTGRSDVGSHPASAISALPFGSIAGDTVQEQLEEIAAEAGGAHPDLASHNTLGLATQAELDTEAATRASADTAESTARASADTAEATARTSVDALLIPLTQKGAASGVATLDAGSKIPAGQLPAIAIGDVFVVASQVAMLALTAERGDVAIRTDLSKSFILSTESPGTLADWKELLTPAAAVSSVDGLTGAVTLPTDGAAGTGTKRTLGTGATQAAAGNDARLSDARTPAAHKTSHEPGGSDAMAVDAAAGVGSLRTLGAGATQAAAGDHGHGAGGAPSDGHYLVGTAHAGLSDEIVVGETPGGELGGTWASPTVDASHSGSTHAAVQAAAEATAATADAAKIDKATLDANTVLYATVNDTPAALAMAASTILARLASGNIVAATPAQLKTLLAIVAADLSDFDTQVAATAILKSLVDAAGDLIVGTGDNAVARLAKGSALQVLRVNSGGTALEWAAASGGLDPNLFDANTVLKADSDNTPVALSMGASTILARLASGSIKAATPAEIKTLLAVVAADVSDFNTAVASTALLKSLADAKGDILVATANDTVVRKPVGSNGSALVADSAQTDGLAWVDVATQVELQAHIDTPHPEIIGVALSDETTAITTGNAKVTICMPFAMTLTAVRASLNTASSSGIPTVDINEGGTTILSTKLTIDATEKTSLTAATAAVISDASLADDAEVTFDIDVAGTGAKGLKVWLIGTRT